MPVRVSKTVSGAGLLVDSSGGFVPNSRHGRRGADKPGAAQRAVAPFPRCRAKDRTASHRRAVEKAAALHGTVRRQRLDHARRTAFGLVRAHDVIAHEGLKTRNMGRAPAPKPAPGRRGAFLSNGAAAKAGLNTSTNDAG
ncbi:hypothetical protein ACWIID_42250 [Streptomyces phaeochromogenes]